MEDRILDTIRAIPEGFVRTYGDVSPGAPRLAGRILKTVDAPDVPWWRVVRSDGSLAAGEKQRARLEAEGVPFRSESKARVDMAIARIPADSNLFRRGRLSASEGGATISARRAIALIATAALLALPLAPEAQAASPFSLVMYSDAGDWIGEGSPRRFDSGNATVQLLLSEPQALTFRVDSPATGEYYFFELKAPEGKVFAPGVYERGGLNVEGSGRGCNSTPARFEVLDIAFSASGQLQRLWVVYEQHCEGEPPALFGEFRYGEPDSPVVPAIVRWPESDVGHVGTTVPVLVRPQGDVAGVSISGPGASQFQIVADGCSGTLGGGSCTVSVRHVPTAAGTHLATLRVTKRAGGTVEAPLQAFAYGGTTKFTLVSDPGDFVGGGGRAEYTTAHVVIWPLWTLDHVRVFIDGLPGVSGNSFHAEFASARGEPFTPGTYAGATRWPFHEPGPGLSVTGGGRGCNRLTGQFTVKEIAFDAHGRIARFGASYEQHCEGAVPALRGEVNFRHGDATPPAPWMRPGPITSIPARGSGGAPTSGPAPTAGKTSTNVKVASLRGLRLSPKAFRNGTRIRFSLDAAADVRFVVKRRWRHPVRVGRSFTRRFAAGPNSFRLGRRVGGRLLKPGRYLLVATPTTGGRRGQAITSRFRLVASRR